MKCNSLLSVLAVMTLFGFSTQIAHSQTVVAAAALSATEPNQTYYFYAPMLVNVQFTSTNSVSVTNDAANPRYIGYNWYMYVGFFGGPYADSRGKSESKFFAPHETVTRSYTLTGGIGLGTGHYDAYTKSAIYDGTDGTADPKFDTRPFDIYSGTP